MKVCPLPYPAAKRSSGLSIRFIVAEEAAALLVGRDMATSGKKWQPLTKGANYLSIIDAVSPSYMNLSGFLVLSCPIGNGLIIHGCSQSCLAIPRYSRRSLSFFFR